MRDPRRAALRYPIALAVAGLLLVSRTALAEVRLRFLGAAGGVGGSAYLLETGEAKVLVDFGLHAGDAARKRNERLQLDPKGVDPLILTHAHTDHVGRVPMLFKEGFRGRVLATEATRQIAAEMLEMSYRIGKSGGNRLYDSRDLREALRSIRPVPYDRAEALPGGAEVRLREAGHIMGSAIAEVRTRGADGLMIVFSGDLGRPASPLQRGPAVVEEADYVVVESTYGAVRRPPSDFREFGAAVRETLAGGGSVLVPAFALDKTQKAIAVIGALKREGAIPREVQVYVDSPSARAITRIYRKHASSVDALSFPGLREVSRKEALWAHRSPVPAIYVSSSGMLDHAGSPQHLAEMVEDPKNLLAIVGWQAPGSVGRRLQEGARTIDIPLEVRDGRGRPRTERVRKAVRMQVKTFGQFSSHADGCEILGWLSHFRTLRRVFVVHGERPGSERLARLIEGNLGIRASVPAEGDVAVLGSEPKRPLVRGTPDLCAGLGDAAGAQTDDE